jgi:hypothetical protein
MRRASGVGEIALPKNDAPAEDRRGWRTIGGDHPMPGKVGFQGEFLNTFGIWKDAGCTA